jgi:NDMA-dependent alcohol dehydrogenase
MMQAEAAILWEPGKDWSIETIDLDAPRAGEVLVRLRASGLCHTDEHLVTGDLGANFPIIGGHEGAGIVEAVGPNVTVVQPGDHVAFSFVPSCGRCDSCIRGRSNLCDNGAELLMGRQLDGTSRHHATGQDLNIFCGLGTFARHTVVSEMSCVKIDPEVRSELACLVSCGVTTGWGAAIYAGGVAPGDNVAVIGLGGIGTAAVQGARFAGAARIFAIDPVEFKREGAPRFGATSTYPSIDEALDPIREVTWGRMCDKVICAMGVGRGSLMASIMALAAKNGRVVVANMHPMAETDVSINMFDVVSMQKQVVGTIFGSANARYDIPHLLQLNRLGHLELESMITNRYQLSDINLAYQDVRDAKNIRGVVVFE